MKTYLIIVEGQKVYIKSDAENHVIQNAINFVPKGEKYTERLLQAIRLQGAKAATINLEVDAMFEVN